jgi:hypothetical protein
MDTRRKTSSTDHHEFHFLPHSAPPTSVIPPPPGAIAVTEFTLDPGSMDQAPSIVSSSQMHVLQPTTSSSFIPDSVASTSAEGFQTSNHLLRQRGNMSMNIVEDGSVANQHRGSSSRSTYCRSLKYSHSGRRGRSDEAGDSEDTIVQVRSEQAGARAEAKAKAKAAEAEQQHIREVQKQQLAIKRREVELQLVRKRKEAKANTLQRNRETEAEALRRNREAEADAQKQMLRS